MAAVESLVSGAIPTRWRTQMDEQLTDAERRVAAAAAYLASGAAARAIEEVYPGVMAAAIVRVWLRDEPWHTRRTHQELMRMMRDELPNGFLALFEMKGDRRNFAGWRAEDAQPLIEEARAFTSQTRAAVESWQKRSPTT
ncbi:MAG: hypothetical protein B7Z72_08115 [Gemmatimonadetes bacterium 21-71-4]|nr:MAG: hypothetical protein B7Z72_08115 [Gemmatimonadetes bacterium 21-71-4]